MLTRPKLTEPFQVVRICRGKCRGTRRIRARFDGSSELDLRLVADQRTIANLWRDAAAAGAPGSGLPARGRRRVAARSRGPRQPRRRRARERPARARHPKGDAFALLGRTSLEWALFDFALALVGAVGAPIYANELAAGRAVRPRALGRGRRARRGRRAAGQGRGARRVAHVLSFADLDDLRARGRAYAAEHPTRCASAASGSTRTTSSRSSTRRERPGRRRPA